MKIALGFEKKIFNHGVFIDLAWGTLQEVSVIQEKFKDVNTAKERILNRYKCESILGTVETGTPKQQAAIGKPCN